LALPEFEVLKAKANFPFNNTTKIQIKFWRFIHPRQSPNIKKVWQSSISPKQLQFENILFASKQVYP